MAFTLKSHQDIARDMATQARQRRLTINLTQQGLANRTGVSLGTIKRFEHTAKISLHSLLKIAVVLDCLSDFEDIFAHKAKLPSIDEILEAEKGRQRGSKN